MTESSGNLFHTTSTFRQISIKIVLTIMLITSFMGVNIYGQVKLQLKNCGTVEYNAELRSKYPFKRSINDFERWMSVKVKKVKEKRKKEKKEKKSLGIQTYTIPVIFHIIHDDETIGSTPNIDAQYINAQIVQLNEDFANLSGSLYAQATDMEIQFCLAQINTSGNCLSEPGINRIDRNSLNFSAPPYTKNYIEDSIKHVTQWDPDQYYNIWTADLANNLFGYSQFPEAQTLPGLLPNTGTASTDGTVVHYNKIGGISNPFPGSAPFNIGRTLTHETGHWLGLRHIWGDGDCGVDDYCSDTPIAASSSSGCPSGLDSCPSSPDPDMFENYMDYSHDNCMNTFTEDQRDRMHVVMEFSPRRPTLLSSSVCTCAPEADFIPQDLTLEVCSPANTIQFEDKSLRVYNFSTYSWSFSGAGVSPTSSSSVNPQINITNSGTLSVSLTVTNVNGSHTKGPVNYTVSSASNPPPAIALIIPSDQSSYISINPVLNWNSSALATGYYYEVATDMNFSNILNSGYTTVDTLQLSGLSPSTDHYWRIFSINACNIDMPTNGNSSPIWSFTTNSTVCQSYTASDIPVTISSTSSSFINSTIQVPTGLDNIVDINILNLDISHSYISDLIGVIEGPGGQSATLFDLLCDSENNLLLDFNDQSSPHNNIPCPPTDGNAYQAFNLLSLFNGLDPSGNWTLHINDTYGPADGGSLNGWAIEICTESPIPCPGDLSLSASANDVTCNGGTDGSVSANANGSATPFTYMWNDASSNNIGTQATLNNLTAGWYFVTVTDANLCTANASVLVLQPTDVNLTVNNHTDVSCNGLGDGEINIMGTGGTIPYAYSWSNGGTTSINSNLTPGNYTVTITDSNNCDYTETFTITEPGPLTSSMLQSQDVSCMTGSDGLIEIVGSGGIGPYSYTWSNGSTNALVSGLTAGSYQFTIVDANSCTYTDQINISEPAAISINLTTTDASCAANSDGSATITVTGGTAGYVLATTDSLNNTVSVGSSVINLSPGWYYVSVVDANACSAQDSFEILSTLQWGIAPTATDESCPGSSNGTLNATLTGGSTNYSYIWEDANGTVVNTTGLTIGTYYITATDINSSCSLSDSVTISSGAGLIFTTGPDAIHTLCDGTNDGDLIAIAGGGTSPYTYVWTDINNNVVADTGNASGTYNVLVTDANGCTLNGTATLGLANTEYTMANSNMLTGNQTVSQDYETNGRIESDQTITGNSNLVDYDSGISIQLKAGFKVTSGTVFRAFIDGCGGAQ